jgi:glycosyltransferase involved in cell wall biosynthesis
MRIGIIGHHVAPIAPPFAGGVESLTWYLARWLAAQGHEVVLHAPAGTDVPGVDVRPFAAPLDLSAAARADVSMPPPAFMATHHAYLELLLGLEPFDVVHVNSLHYLPVAMAPLLDVPALLTLHTPPTPWLESALRATGGAGLSVCAVSSAAAGMWSPVLDVDAVVPNGVDLDAWPAGPGGEGAAWAGRFVPEKAPHLAIDAARAAGVALRLAGPIVDRAYWAAEVAPRLGPGAEYVGHLGHAELATLLGRSEVALLTPIWAEPFGLAAAEALACGTPVAAFARGALDDVVGPAGGRLAAPEDVDALAAALLEARTLDRGAVRAYAEAELGLDAMGRAYEQLYLGLRDAAAPARLLEAA